MENKIKVINRYLIDKDCSIHKGLHMVSNKSIWKKLLVSIWKISAIELIKYEGNIRRSNISIIENNSLIKIETLMVSYFLKNGDCYYYDIKIRHGILREKDSLYNDDFEKKINNLYHLICENNSYNDSEYKEFVKSLKAKLC